jgi:cysteinyl-tRNA synthetase
MKELTAILGLFNKKIIGGGCSEDQAAIVDGLMNLLIELRKQARANKNFSMADTIRAKLTEQGIALLDGKEGTTWEKA